jgi:hypothetical protein
VAQKANAHFHTPHFCASMSLCKVLWSWVLCLSKFVFKVKRPNLYFFSRSGRFVLFFLLIFESAFIFMAQKANTFSYASFLSDGRKVYFTKIEKAPTALVALKKLVINPFFQTTEF